MKKKLLLLFIPFLMLTVMIPETSFANDADQEDLIKEYRLKIVCRVVEYLWRHYDIDQNTKEKWKIHNACENERTLQVFIDNQFANEGTKERNRTFLRALYNEDSYKNKFTFKVNYNENQTLDKLVVQIRESLIENNPARETDPQHKPHFDRLIDDLKDIAGEYILAPDSINEIVTGQTNGDEHVEQEVEVTIIPDKTEVSLEASSEKSITLTITPADQPISIGVGDESVIKATLDNGTLIIEGIRQGTSNITLSPKAPATGEDVEIVVTVTPQLIDAEYAYFVPKILNLQEGGEREIGLIYYPRGAATMFYGQYQIGGNEQSIKVEPVSGTQRIKITARAVGSATVKLEYHNQSTNTSHWSEPLTVNVVSDEIDLTTLEISNKPAFQTEFEIGDTLPEFVLLIEPDNHTQTIGFDSEDPTIVEIIDDLGQGKAISAGKTYLFVYSENLRDSVLVSVVEPTIITPPKEEKSETHMYYFILSGIVIILAVLLFFITKKYRRLKSTTSQELHAYEMKLANLGDRQTKTNQENRSLFKENQSLNEQNAYKSHELKRLQKQHMELQEKFSSLEKQVKSHGPRADFEKDPSKPKPSPPPPPTPPPPPPPPKPKKYAYYPDTPSGFSLSELRDKAEVSAIYVLTIHSDNKATFAVSEESIAQAKAFNNTSYLLDRACDYQNSPDDGKKIVTEQEGVLVKTGDQWKITQKAKIRFV